MTGTTLLTSTNGAGTSNQNFSITISSPPDADSPAMPIWALIILGLSLLLAAKRSLRELFPLDPVYRDGIAKVGGKRKDGSGLATLEGYTDAR